MTIISNRGKQRLRRFIANAQSHLQWLRIQKWNLEQEIEKARDKSKLNSQYCSTCCRIAEVVRDIEAAYKLVS